MKIISVFYTLGFLMMVLTFGVSFGAPAQQHSVQTEAEAASAEDMNAVRLKARDAAESDASDDINKLMHFAEGVAVALISGISVCGASNTFPESVSICIGGLAGVGLLGGLISTYSYLPTPLSERLIGKSPEYVTFYTDAYKTKARSLRIRLAIVGAATGCGCITTCSVTYVWALLKGALRPD